MTFTALSNFDNQQLGFVQKQNGSTQMPTSSDLRSSGLRVGVLPSCTAGSVGRDASSTLLRQSLMPFVNEFDAHVFYACLFGSAVWSGNSSGDHKIRKAIADGYTFCLYCGQHRSLSDDYQAMTLSALWSSRIDYPGKVETRFPRCRARFAIRPGS